MLKGLHFCSYTTKRQLIDTITKHFNSLIRKKMLLVSSDHFSLGKFPIEAKLDVIMVSDFVDLIRTIRSIENLSMQNENDVYGIHVIFHLAETFLIGFPPNAIAEIMMPLRRMANSSNFTILVLSANDSVLRTYCEDVFDFIADYPSSSGQCGSSLGLCAE